MLNTAPYEWTIDNLMNHINHGPRVTFKDNHCEPARPYGYYSLRNRLRLSWMVFTGKADALRWPRQNPKAY